MPLLVVLCLLLLLPCQVQSRSLEGDNTVVHSAPMPSTTEDAGFDSSVILPPPPAFDSALMMRDRAQYEAGLLLRQTPRGKQAQNDANYVKLIESFSEALGMPISAEHSPELLALLTRTSNALAHFSTNFAKKHFKRIRPYVLYKANTCEPAQEERFSHTFSYPSGHSARGWGLALLLAEIAPNKTEALLRRDYEIGQSRVICGYHWQSDVDASRMTASATLAGLHSNPEFLAQLAKAKKEFAALQQRVVPAKS